MADMKVYVHLAHGYSPSVWQIRFDEGLLIGINERDAYGYRRAEHMGAIVTSSDDHAESRLGKLHRLGWRWILGFDIVHVLRNRRNAYEADVIWTHTESQFLGILLMFILSRRKARRPKLIAQSVWLIDHWHRQPWLRRWLWRRLIAHADILTFHSPENLAIARQMFPRVASELVLFGIRADIIAHAESLERSGAVRLISVGNDHQRSWATLIDAVANRPGWHLRIVSTTCPQTLADNVANVTVAGVKTNDELMRLYRESDIAIVPLKPNFHASGITAIQEATLCGLPTITSDTGGLRAYFSDTEVCYVDPHDSSALAGAITKLADDTIARATLVVRAQEKMGPDGLSSEAFVRRHVEISQTLLDAS